MKKTALILVVSLLSVISCDNDKAIFERENCKTPFTIRYEDKEIGYREVFIDYQLLKSNDKFSFLELQKIYSKGRFYLKDSIITLLVNQDPIETYSGDFYLMNFDLNRNPLDEITIRDMELIDSTVITKDTIFKYISYRTTKWVEKYCINNDGQFVLKEEKKIWEIEDDEDGGGF